MSTVDVRDHSMMVDDGRGMAWSGCGSVDSVPLLVTMKSRSCEEILARG